MKTSTVLSAVALALSITVCTQTARADTRDATCEVRKDDDTVALRPADKANHFKDQHGHKVVRTQSGGSSQTFKWEVTARAR